MTSRNSINVHDVIESSPSNSFHRSFCKQVFCIACTIILVLVICKIQAKRLIHPAISAVQLNRAQPEIALLIETAKT